MVQLRDDASLEDVVNEIIITEVMLDTLEPDDDNYDEEHAYHKQYLAKLREMQDSHTGGSLIHSSGKLPAILNMDLFPS